MRASVAHKATLHPFSLLQEIGLSQAAMQRLIRYRNKHESLGRAVAVMTWPDGNWGVLAMHTEKLSLVAIEDDQKAAAYEYARSMIEGGYLPLLHLRWEFHA